MGEGGGGGRLFEAGRLLTFPTYRVGAYSRWALISGWALNRINKVDQHDQILPPYCKSLNFMTLAFGSLSNDEGDT